MENNNYRIDLAPLQGHTDACFRNAHEAIFGGVDTYYTPFVRLEKGNKFRSRELRDIKEENNTVTNLVPQILASTVEEMEALTELIIENGYDRIDVNMGCPFPMLARRHKGSGILAHPEEVKAILDYIKTQDKVKFSVKMRLGWDDPKECMALIDMLNDTPLEHICLHARVGKQQYKGETDLDAFELFYNECKHPLMYNGDLLTIDDIQAIKDRFPRLIGVMIGRGLLANPALAAEFKAGETMDKTAKKKKMVRLHSELFEHYSAHLDGGDKQILEKMKPFWSYLTKELEKRTRKKIEKASKIANYEAAVGLAFSQWGKVIVVDHDQDDDEAIY